MIALALILAVGVVGYGWAVTVLARLIDRASDPNLHRRIYHHYRRSQP